MTDNRKRGGGVALPGVWKEVELAEGAGGLCSGCTGPSLPCRRLQTPPLWSEAVRLQGERGCGLEQAAQMGYVATPSRSAAVPSC